MKTIKLIILSLLILSGFNLTAQSVFTHKSSTANTRSHITTIDNAATNGKTSKLLFVTQVYNGKYNNHPLGVWYTAGKWTIYQENKVALDNGSTYNVLAVNPSKKAFMHKASASNISNNWTTINHPSCNNNPNAVLLVTQNWKGTYNAKSIGVWYSNGKWTIYNQDRSAMPTGTSFNVLVMSKGHGNVSGGKASIFTATTTAKQNRYGNHLANLPLTKRSAKIFVTQNYGSRGPYNAHESAVWLDGNTWTVYNKDKAELPTNTQFNVLVIGAKNSLSSDNATKKFVPRSNGTYSLNSPFSAYDITNKNGTGIAEMGSRPYNQWVFEKVEDNIYRLKEVKSGKYLHIQNSKLEVGDIQSNWWSAMWELEHVSGNYYRIKCRWNKYGQPIYLQNPKRNLTIGSLTDKSAKYGQWRVRQDGTL